MTKSNFEIEFYEDEHGDRPVLRWIREELTPFQRLALGKAMRLVLQEKGIGVCGSEFGKQLGGGLFEFRLRRDIDDDPSEKTKILLRVFCHAYGNKVVLMLGGYDKALLSSTSHQQKQISIARSRLERWKQLKR